MAKRPKLISAVRNLSYFRGSDTFRFTFMDRAGTPHPYYCDYAMFEYVIQEFSTRLIQAEQVRTNRRGPHLSTLDEEIKLDVHATSDGRIRLRISAEGNKSFEVRFEPAVAPALIQALEKAYQHFEPVDPE